MYFLRPISEEVRLFQVTFHNYKRTKKLLLVSIFACFAAIFQATGGYLPGIGYFISPLATGPILLCSMFSIPVGFMSYILTITLLFVLQPTELIIFPFTTGLLGLGIGASFHFFRKRISIIAAGSVLLTIGIISLLFIFRFPILGPVGSDSFSIHTTGGIFLFTFLYSWLWVEMALLILKRIKIIIIE
ncbi:hypothetical protein [Paucisalibacillus sp. EB02]|uniref:hypothetical protein n=1 Tax=Paucisalibacillus sp. EB02 TaxID=1347087 RepID=UPI0004B650DE|nr:hypothetical protein [Paucisalibacillus sp. EB02]